MKTLDLVKPRLPPLLAGLFGLLMGGLVGHAMIFLLAANLHPL